MRRRVQDALSTSLMSSATFQRGGFHLGHRSCRRVPRAGLEATNRTVWQAAPAAATAPRQTADSSTPLRSVPRSSGTTRPLSTASGGGTGYPPRAKPARFQTPLPPKGSALGNPPTAVYRALYPDSRHPGTPAVEFIGGDGPAAGGFPVDDLVYVPDVVTTGQAAALDKELAKSLKRRR